LAYLLENGLSVRRKSRDVIVHSSGHFLRRHSRVRFGLGPALSTVEVIWSQIKLDCPIAAEGHGPPGVRGPTFPWVAQFGRRLSPAGRGYPLQDGSLEGDEPSPR
jgi:hypothetical protein